MIVDIWKCSSHCSWVAPSDITSYELEFLGTSIRSHTRTYCLRPLLLKSCWYRIGFFSNSLQVSCGDINFQYSAHVTDQIVNTLSSLRKKCWSWNVFASDYFVLMSWILATPEDLMILLRHAYFLKQAISSVCFWISYAATDSVQQLLIPDSVLASVVTNSVWVLQPFKLRCVWFKLKVGWDEGNIVHLIFRTTPSQKITLVFTLSLCEFHLNIIENLAVPFYPYLSN